VYGRLASALYCIALVIPVTLAVLAARMRPSHEAPVVSRDAQPDLKDSSTTIFEPDELARLTTARLEQSAASTSAPLLLVIVGKVYDVSAGHEHYSTGAGYEGFIGKDASRAFLSADFEQHASDDLDGLKPGECLGVEGWCTFYANHSKYSFVGLLHGRYYGPTGLPTEALHRYEACVERGRGARRAARAAAMAASHCHRAAPTSTEPRFRIGTWVTYSCPPPLSPRRLVLAEADGGELCACLPAVGDAAWDPVALGMEDDQELPQPYHRKDCAGAESVCNVRSR